MPTAAQVPESADRGFRIFAPRTVDQVIDAAPLFDAPPSQEATERFLAAVDHHLLFAVDRSGVALGFVSGVETTHPDKGTEMFLYELGVAESARGRGVATALVDALRRLGTDRGCYAMWVVTDPDNAAAQATYRKAGAQDAEATVMLSWDLSSAHRQEQG